MRSETFKHVLKLAKLIALIISLMAALISLVSISRASATPREYTVTVKVTGHDGTPVSGLGVDTIPFSRNYYTDSNGIAVLSLEPGNYTLLTCHGQYLMKRNIDVDSDMTVVLDARAEDLCDINSKLFDISDTNEIFDHSFWLCPTSPGTETPACSHLWLFGDPVHVSKGEYWAGTSGYINGVGHALHKLVSIDNDMTIEFHPMRDPTGKILLQMFDPQGGEIEGEFMVEPIISGEFIGWVGCGRSSGDIVYVTPGDYRHNFYLTKASDDKIWEFRVGIEERFTVNTGEEITISAGGPFDYTVRVDKSNYLQGEHVHITLSLKDSFGNESHWFNTHWPYESLQHEVVVKCLETNATIYSTSIESSWAMENTFTLPSDASQGDYRVTSTLDTGPFAGVISAETDFSVSDERKTEILWIWITFAIIVALLFAAVLHLLLRGKKNERSYS